MGRHPIASPRHRQCYLGRASTLPGARDDHLVHCRQPEPLPPVAGYGCAQPIACPFKARGRAAHMLGGLPPLLRSITAMN